jgi:hypothetical protein
VRKQLMLGLAASAAAVVLFVSLPSQAQDNQNKTNGLPDGFKAGGGGKGGGKGKGKAKGPSRPTPRNADGRVIFGPIAGEKGVWQGSAGATLTRSSQGRGGQPPAPLPPTNVAAMPPVNPTEAEIPFLDWSRGLYDYRRESLTADDPHVRCKSSGGARLYHTPYGFEIVEVPEMQQMLVMGTGGPHTYRVIYLDGRPHPTDLDPTYHGHSIGTWESKDKLVIDTVGFNQRFWLAREGYPHTEKLHTIETLERPEYDALRYTITVDDPGAYSAKWTAGWSIPWSSTAELYEYICQENNRDSRHMFGGDSSN